MVSSESRVRWPPRIVIGAPQGHSGKTSVSIGLCAVLKHRGLVVQPFKKGPDYIDPSWLTAAAGRPCYNLDIILMTEATMLASFQRAGESADLALVEGAMGLYDGFGTEGRGSTAQIARLLRSPVILVVNAARMTHSIAAMVSGYQHFEPKTGISGVILNNVSGSRHERKLVTAIEQYCGIPVVGSIPRDSGLSIAERHLGLIPFLEAEKAVAIIDRIRRRLELHLNVDSVVAIARSAPAVTATETNAPQKKAAVVRLGVVFDRVFNFYYPDNLAALTRAGAELVFIDSLQHQHLPDIDGLYIGGGFPEMFLPELESNSHLRQDIAQAVADYLPVYAECAGLMYLCRGISWRGQRYDMIGAINSEVEVCSRPQGHGYVLVQVTQANPLFPVGLTFWGHEFHHSRLTMSQALKFAYTMRHGRGIDGKVDGIVDKNVVAAYTHLHALAVSQWAESLVSLSARKYQPSLTGHNTW